MIYFTADTHFNHKNIIKYCKRPFETVDEMNKVLISNWNKRVTNTDTIFHLGDFGFGSLEPILKQLNGKKILIIGSHDRDTLNFKRLFLKVTPLLRLNTKTETIILCHYAMRVWDISHYNSWHLYGHSHGKLTPIGKSLDVGVDNHNFTPWSLDEIKRYMQTRPNNFNFIKK